MGRTDEGNRIFSLHVSNSSAISAEISRAMSGGSMPTCVQCAAQALQCNVSLALPIYSCRTPPALQSPQQLTRIALSSQSPIVHSMPGTAGVLLVTPCYCHGSVWTFADRRTSHRSQHVWLPANSNSLYPTVRGPDTIGSESVSLEFGR
jgi:hypothetical protein